MCFLPEDERFLRDALELARGTAAFASPNPAVGCVLARGGAVLGEGAHRYDRRDHAEVVALKQAAERDREVCGATAYVTLEPCSHHGRTGPCAEALVTAGITRCVVATVDPNPLVRGQGLARLRAAGIEVVVAEPASALAIAARRLNDGFAFAIQHRRPFVTLKSAISADGKLAPAPTARLQQQPHWITGLAARAEVQELRHEADALLSGIGTVLADDPELTDRTGIPRRRPLLRVIADRHLRMPEEARLVRGAQGDLLLLAGKFAPRDREAALLRAGAEVVRLDLRDGQLDLHEALAVLTERGIVKVLLEAGSALNGAMLRESLVDRVVLYRGPEPLGAEGVPFAKGGPAADALLANLGGVAQSPLPHGDAGALDLRVTGYLHDPWSGV